MRKFLFSFFMLAFLQPTLTWAQSNPDFNKQAFMHEGLLKVEDELLILSRDTLPQDPSCPAGGHLVFENMFWIKDTLFTAMNSIDQLTDNVKPAIDQKRAENNRCGSCRQNNLVSSIASISPERTVTVPECQNRPEETFHLNIKSKKEIAKFTEALLKGKNTEGKRLAAGCPDPCAYYVNTAQTNLPSGDIHLALTVQCGQPRKDSVFSATYEYNSGVIHQWTCSK
jgi:hypothetical protein